MAPRSVCIRKLKSATVAEAPVSRTAATSRAEGIRMRLLQDIFIELPLVMVDSMIFTGDQVTF